MSSKTRHRANIITMGCSKNLVDSERLVKMLDDAGYDVVCDADGFTGDVVVINTCGFIGDAKEESIDMILRAVQAKQGGAVGAVYVMGCLSERYRKELPEELPEVDGWYGKFDWTGVLDALKCRIARKSETWERRLTTPPHHAYLKIAEGCNRFCAFCAIPLITGRYQSRPIDEIEAEVRQLVAGGVSEFNIIAQDLSYYGRDIYGKSALAELIERLSEISGVKRLRLHYAYPADFPYDVLPVMASRSNVCAYLDIALQHISDRVLQNMRRHITGDETRELLARIRREVPGIHIRTTLMVGFPGEREEDFEQLLDFVGEQRFERMGAFAYCEEDDTYAAKHFQDAIPETVKQQRLDRLMALQHDIALEISEQKVGQTIEVVVDSETPDFYIGRTEFDSPEVDPEVYIAKTRQLTPGTYVNVKITGAQGYDLLAEPADGTAV